MNAFLGSPCTLILIIFVNIKINIVGVQNIVNSNTKFIFRIEPHLTILSKH